MILVDRRSRVGMYATTAAVVLGLGAVHSAFIGHYSFTGTWRFYWEIVFAVVESAAAYALGLPDEIQNFGAGVGRALGAVLSGAAVVSLVQLAAGTPLLPRFVIGWSVILLVPDEVAWYAIARIRSGAARNASRVLLVADEVESATLESDLDSPTEKAVVLAGSVTVDAARGRPDLSTSRVLFDEVRRLGATVLVLDRAAQDDDVIVTQAVQLHRAGVRIRTLALFYDEWLGKLPLSELERVSLLFDIGEVHSVPFARIRRIRDVLFSLMGCVVLVPVTVIVVAANWLGNRGPVLFRQTRVGREGKEFQIIKFRTMRPGTDTGEWAAPDDPRVTPVGRWLRRIHVDELPQMINVLRGDLSLVGPRPEQVRYVEELSSKIPFYSVRHLVRPGVTGWAQVKYRYGSTELDAWEKLQYDFFYLRHQGLLFDMRIIGRTLRRVIGGGVKPR